MKKQKVLLLLYLTIIIIIPCTSYILKNLKKSIVTEAYNVNVLDEIVGGTSITQDIYIPSHLRKYGINFATYARKNSGYINVKIIQNDKIIEEQINVSTIEDNKTRYLNLDFSKLKKGEALLIIEGIDGTPGNAVTLYQSKDTSLGSIKINGENTDYGLMGEYIFLNFDRVIRGQILFLVLSVLSYFYLIKLCEDRNKNNRKIYFTTVLISFFIINVKAPIVSFAVEPYAEIVFNFYDFGINKGIVDNIFMTERVWKKVCK